MTTITYIYKLSFFFNIQALIEAAEERQKSEASVNGNEGVIGLEDFGRDAVAEAFGDDGKRSYCRAISSTSNAEYVKLTQASKVIINHKENEDKRWKMEMQHKIDQMHEESRITNSTLAEMQQCIRQLVSHIGTTPMTPITEIGSHTEHHPSPTPTPTPSNAAIGSSSVERQAVQLLSRKLKVVAKGHLGVQKICHGRKVGDREKVVWVEDVLDPDEPLFDAPQNGHYALSELVDGGFVIWPEGRIRSL